MRLAFIADIHGNTPALEAVLDDLSHESVDEVLVLGDTVLKLGDGPGAVAMLSQIRHQAVYGNMEWAVLTHGTTDYPEHWGPIAGEEVHFAAIDIAQTRATLGKEFFQRLQATIRLETPAGTLLACHGSPDSCVTDLQGHIELTSPWAQDDVDFTRRLGAGNDVPIVVCSHTHTPFVRRSGSTLVINSGAVGWSRAPVADRYKTRYMILTLETGRNPRIDWRALPYDNQAALTAFRQKQASIESQLRSDDARAASRTWHDYLATMIIPH